MMTKIRSIQDSWLAKSILILTALSFMSLFGVSGYWGSAGKNKEIIKVDDVVVYQDEINSQFQQQLQQARNLFGEDLDINDAMKNAIMQDIVQKNLTNAIMQKTTDDLDVSISDELIRKIIYSQAEFMDANGNFSIEKLRRLLGASGWSEKRYIETLRGDIEKQHLLQHPAENINIPHFMDKYLAQLENQRKVFKYIEVDPAKLSVDRKISNDELEQYYQDFIGQFEEPEKRDLQFVNLSVDALAAKMTPSEEDIKAYYQENISNYVIPETRRVLQMMFEDQDSADKAMAALNAGGDFYKVAQDAAGQDKAATELGDVSKDMLLADMSEAVFAAPQGEVVGPIKSELGWHILKVTKITPKKETTLAAAKNKIVEALRKEKAFDEAYNTIAEIEDKIGGGATLQEISESYNTPIYKVSGLKEDGTTQRAPVQFKKLISSADFIDAAFSYNTGEISQAVEDETGFTIVEVVAIEDAHPKELSEVKSQIETMWAANEKNAIAQEIINDVTHDVENGDSLDSVAKRFNLSVKTTKPVKRTESFAGLSQQQMAELFQENIGSLKLIAHNDGQLLIVPTKVIKGSATPSKEEIEVLRSKAKADMSQTVVDELLNAYSSNYDVRVKYKYVGLTEDNE